MRVRGLRGLAAGAVVVALLVPGTAGATAAGGGAGAGGASTAWHDGAFREDVPGIVGRSDVVLGQPNTAAAQAMPLGNGSLGVGVWAANGFTAQLNRADTLPDR